jgi:hypothetical protein
LFDRLGEDLIGGLAIAAVMTDAIYLRMAERAPISRLARVEEREGSRREDQPVSSDLTSAWKGPAAAVLRLQRTAGNRATTQYLQRFPFPKVIPTQDDAPVGARPRGPESDYVTAAQGYIIAYAGAAKSGVVGFVAALPASKFDWGAFWAGSSGNVVWATASFATGGGAFVISLAGIAISTAAGASTAPDDSFDAGKLMIEASNKVDDVDTYLNNQVNRVVSEVYAQGSANTWDDNRTRTEILKRMFTGGPGQYYTTFAGGIPNVNDTAISASVKEELLLLANAQGSKAKSPSWQAIDTPIADYHGYVMYSYSVPNLFHGGGFFSQPSFAPLDEWKLSAPVVGLIPSANIGDINKSMNETQAHGFPKKVFDVDKFPCKKAVSIYGDEPEWPTVVVELDEKNAVVRTTGTRAAELFGKDGSAGFGTKVLNKVWGGTTPPSVGKLELPASLYEISDAGVGF